MRNGISRYNRTVIGVSALFERDPRDRPKNLRKTGSQPLCHASTREDFLSYREKWNDFRNEFIKASWDFCNGYWEREFPPGCYRPPTIRLCSNDEL